jgi:hypothetical protein
MARLAEKPDRILTGFSGTQVTRVTDWQAQSEQIK